MLEKFLNKFQKKEIEIQRTSSIPIPWKDVESPSSSTTTIKKTTNTKKKEKTKVTVKKRATKIEKKEALEKFNKQLNSLLEKKEFITVTSSNKLSSEEIVPRKSWKTLKVLASEAPGAIQCVNIIKNRMLGGGFIIVPADEKSELNEKDEEYIRLKDFILEPNYDETLEDIFGAMIQNYLYYGISYLEMVRESNSESKKKGLLKQIFILDVSSVKILIDEGLKNQGVNLIVGFSREFGTKQKKILYELDEVFTHKRPSPEGNIYGEAILENHQAILSMVIQALTYNVNFLKNDGKGPLQINLPEGTGRAEGEAMQAFHEKHYTGPANAGRTLILFGGAKASTLGTTIKDMDYLSLLQFCKKEVAGMFGVPLVMISDPEGANRATSIEERKGFHVNQILPERAKLLRKFNKEIVKEGLKISKYKLDIEELDVDDQGKLTKEAKEAVSSGLASHNEACAYANWEKVNEDWADKKIIIDNGKATILDDDYFKRQAELSNALIQNDKEKKSSTNNNKNTEAEDKKIKEEEEKERKRKESTKKNISKQIAEMREEINKYLDY